jgi:16S rRNA (cytosine1402-N4)-methyltransferase
MPVHYPVLLAETIEYLAVKPDGRYLDCTAGLGGHTKGIAELLTGGGRLYSNDRDAESLELAKQNAAEFADRIEFRCGEFSELDLTDLDGMIADLGVSRFQLTGPQRGFSFQSDGPLDMRMDQSRGETAADLINHSAEKAISDWLFQLGEERRARKIARAIVRARPIRSTLHLAGVVERAVPRTGPIHPATKTFQAIRIVVNREMEEIDSLLDAAPRMVRPGGRIVIISFHSLEDRKVKESFRELARSGRGVVLTKKPIVPGERELGENAASRSAKLRAAEIAEQGAGGASDRDDEEISGAEKYRRRKARR